jgi:hypothetical protein
MAKAVHTLLCFATDSLVSIMQRNCSSPVRHMHKNRNSRVLENCTDIRPEWYKCHPFIISWLCTNSWVTLEGAPGCHGTAVRTP